VTLDPTSSSYPEGVGTTADLDAATEYLIKCRACPRLVEFRAAVAATGPIAYRGTPYWSKPLPAFGDPAAHIMVVGLAPSAHGSNRTGRAFTGDRSGDFFFASLHRLGIANIATAHDVDDGLALDDVVIAGPVRCVPPNDKPSPEERRRCGPYLAHELELIGPRVVVALGAFGWDAVCRTLGEQGWDVPKPRPKFGHGAEVVLRHATSARRLTLLGTYHPSPHNTNTGRLTPAAMDAIFERARELATASDH
jgi:uracil-DNA glycosylase family 4